MQKGKLEEAEGHLSNAVNANGFNKVLGNLDIARGNYSRAADELKDEACNSAALAQLLAKDYDAAKKTLKSIKNPDAMTSYLHAIVSARQGNSYAAGSYLKEALQKDPSLAAMPTRIWNLPRSIDETNKLNAAFTAHPGSGFLWD